MSSSDGSSSTSSQEGRDDNELMFIAHFVKDHPIILNKSQIPSVKTKKEEYLKQMKIDIQNKCGTMMDSEKILKKLNYLKTNIKNKTDRKATGNRKIKLSAAQSVLYDIMQGGRDENPVFSKVPEDVVVGVSKDVTENIKHPRIKIHPVLVFQKKKNIDLHETSETKKNSNSGLQRLVLLEQLQVIRMEKEILLRKKIGELQRLVFLEQLQVIRMDKEILLRKKKYLMVVEYSK
ncbi:hypothetical protein JTB14_022058 [Gonioctena quinquepunctata]|nr:hypothetical protein JTB14_022058 [Gonioctena quinquepunctata]